MSTQTQIELLTSNLIYSETDLSGIITYVSKPFEDISGYTQSELIGKSHNIVRHPDMSKDIFDELWTTIKSGKTWNGIVRNLTKKGSSYYVKATVAPRYSNNKIIGYFSTREDITSLIKEKRKSQAVFNAQHSIVIVSDGNNIIDINRSFFKIFGFLDLEDFKSNHHCICELFVDKGDKTKHLKANMDGINWLEYIELHKDKVHEVYMIDKNGHENVYEVKGSGKIFEEEEEEEEEVIVFTDITYQKYQQQILIQQSRFASMGEMISMIAHQWRQPLSTINGIVAPLDLKYKMGMDVDPKDAIIKFAKQNEIVQHLSTTIEDFMGFFRNNGTKEKIYIQDLVNGTIRLIEDSYASSFVELVVNNHINDKTPISIQSNKFKQALLNILKNALDEFVDNKNIKDPKTVLDIMQYDNNIKILITDNAGGIPENILANIWDAYFSTKDKNGTGIGLYMTKIFIEDHLDGTIKAYNTNSGACFEIILPLN